ncbi:GntR family transcriptional regulator [Flexithrix dorotheae]|uniref:GntR family transcriptional regulator n=1 Tax=Flexithrix dorotheae TaxID=70993 RepID=UPI000366F6C1|nr:GntR family transcriptional regulator [Flexithrix dorotheae]
MNKPKHQLLYEKLKDLIENGTYKPGDYLPSENQLCQSFDTARPTVRQALLSLENEGLIKRYQGKGSIVQSLKKGIGILSIEGTTLGFQGKELTTEIIMKPTWQQFPKPFWFSLSSTEIDAGCIVLERLRKVEGKPILFETTYLPNINLPGFTRRNLTNKSLFKILTENYNIKILGGVQKFWAQRPEQKTRDLLEVNKEVPLLHLKRKIETNRFGFYIYSSLYCNTQEFFLEGRF